MKCCMVGVGSIAIRHIRNLKSMLGDSITIDAYHHSAITGSRVIGNDRCNDVTNMIEKHYYEYDEVPKNYDIIFITNATSAHLESIYLFCNNAKALFIEKPIIMANQRIEYDKINGDVIAYVACPLRYSNIIRYLKKNLDIYSVRSVRAISSSYLPDWRPNQDYRSSYSSSKRLGGGVAIDLIHEWDYITYLFGYPTGIKSIMSHVSDLDIDSEDIAIYIARYSDMVAEIHVDYFGRVPMRRIEIITEDDTIVCDFIERRIDYLKSGKTIECKEERDDMQSRELEHFMDIIEGRISNDSDIYGAERLVLMVGNEI